MVSRHLVNRMVFAVITATLLLSGLEGVATAQGAPTRAVQRCVQATAGSGTCYRVSAVRAHRQVVASTIVRGPARGSAEKKCAFATLATRSVAASVRLAPGGASEIVRATHRFAKTDVYPTVTGTNSWATVRLRQGDAVRCELTYRYLRANVTVVHYSSSSVWVEHVTAAVPISIGLAVADA